MRSNHKHKPLRKNANVFRHLVVSVCRLIAAERAVNAVISNLILIAAVIVIGFAALAYVNSTSNNYVTQYGQSVNSDIDKLRETVAFEYVYYNSTSVPKTLSVYFMNAGKINNVIISNSTVSNSTWSTTFNCIGATKYLNNTSTGAFSMGEEGYFIQTLNIALVSGSDYTIKIKTGRGSVFEYIFAP